MRLPSHLATVVASFLFLILIVRLAPTPVQAGQLIAPDLTNPRGPATGTTNQPIGPGPGAEGVAPNAPAGPAFSGAAQAASSGNVAVQVLDPSNGGVTGALGSLMPVSTTATSSISLVDAGNGVYTATNVPSGTYDVWMLHTNFTVDSIPTIDVGALAPTTTATVRMLFNDATLSGTVRDATTGSPIISTPAFLVALRPASGPGNRSYGVTLSASTNPQGVYTYTLASATYPNFSIRANGYQTSHVFSFTVAPGPATRDFVLTPVAVTPTATPTITATATVTATPTVSATATPTATPTVSATATVSIIATPTATPTSTPTSTPTATPTSTPTATPTQPVPGQPTNTPAPVAGPVSPATGGTLTNNNGSVSLTFPPGAVNQPVTVSYNPQTPPQPPAGAISLAGFSLSATTSGGTTISQFSAPVTITVRYDPAALGSVPETAVQIFFLNAQGQWIALATSVDPIQHVARARVDHFTPFAAFASPAGTVTPGPTNTATAVPSRTPTAVSVGTGSTERISNAAGGGPSNGYSAAPALSADGRFVAFVSEANNLVPNDTNNVGDVFLRDRQTGALGRVSVANDGSQLDNGGTSPAISGDGRQVAFVANGEILIRDLRQSATERVSIATGGSPAKGTSFSPALSADGRFVAFASSANNLVPNDTNGVSDIFVRDRLNKTTERVSVASAGSPANDASYFPAISADGRFVAFVSEASNLVPGDTNGVADVFVRDRLNGTTERVSIATDGSQALGSSQTPVLSGDGRFVAFSSAAPNLVPNDTNGQPDIFVRDRVNAITDRASVASDGSPANGVSTEPALSADGRYLAFRSTATNLVPNDTNGQPDIFVRDRQAGATRRVSLALDGSQSNGSSAGPAISLDARNVAFASAATNLVPNDPNGQWDVFVRDRFGSATPATPTATVPAGATPTATPTTNPRPFVIGLTPLNGSNSTTTTITINGANFRSGAQVSLISGGSSRTLTNSTIVDSFTLRADVPAGLPPGTYDLLVTNSDGTTSSPLPGAFTVTALAPAATSVLPDRGSNLAATDLLVTGSNFRSGATIALVKDGISPTVVLTTVQVIDSGRVAAIVPGGLTPGLYDVVVQNAGSNDSSSLRGAYTVFSPQTDDFYVAANDIWTNPTSVRRGDTVQLGINLHRQGGRTTVQVPVAFYQGDPSAGGTLIGQTTSAPIPASGELEPVSLSWSIGQQEGAVSIYALIDPAGTLTETDRTNNQANRVVTVLPPGPDLDPPAINNLVVNNGSAQAVDVVIPVGVAATDPAPGTGVATMYLVEREFNSSAKAWVPIQTTGWITYSSTYTMTLTNRAGVRYLQAYVSDGAGNISLNVFKRSLDFEPPIDSLKANQVRLYRRTLAVGDTISARLAPQSGDADLWIWDPNNNSVVVRNNSGQTVDEGSYTALTAGVYQIEVFAYSDTTYQLSLAVAAGGNQPPAVNPDPGKTQRVEPIVTSENEPEGRSAVPQAPVNAVTLTTPTPTTYRAWLPLLARVKGGGW